MSASWKRAVNAVTEKYESGERNKYSIKGKKYDVGWVYQIHRTGKKISIKPKSVKVSLTREQLFMLMERLPKCVARANSSRGGDFKVALPSRDFAHAVSMFIGTDYYKCTIPFPAFGEHWHMKTKKGKK